MIKVLLIDDEKHALVTLAHYLESFKEIEILDSIQDSRLAKDRITELKPDIVFLDIEMPFLNGFEVLQQFETLPFKVVFTTAYDQYAIKALKLNALDYVLKPIEIDELKQAIDKYHQQELLTTTEQVSNLAKFTMTQMSDTLALSTLKGLIFIKIEDIMYFSASNAYTFVVMNNGDKHLVSKSLVVFEEVLSDNPIFFRVHKSYLINLKFISQYIRGEGGEIIMQDRTSVVLSRNKKQDFLNLFKKI